MNTNRLLLEMKIEIERHVLRRFYSRNNRARIIKNMFKTIRRLASEVSYVEVVYVTGNINNATFWAHLLNN